MIYAKWLIMSDGTQIDLTKNVLLIPKRMPGANRTEEEFWEKVKPHLPCAQNVITYYTRSWNEKQRNALLKKLLDGKRVSITRSGKARIYHLA